MADFPLSFVLQVKNEMGSGISQATGQIQGLGEAADQTQKKAKSSGMGVGQAFQFVALNAFNLASSLIQTKRSYEDLAKAENAQKGLKDTVTKLTNRLRNAEISLYIARQKGDPLKIAKAENNLKNAHINLDKAVRAEKFGQVELNRAHQDFYLNIIPNVISGLGTMFGLFQVLQGSGGIGGLIKTIGKLALPFGVIVGLFIALKENFLGITTFFQNLGRDIGKAVPQLKPFLDLIESIFANLGIGDKAKAKGLNKLAKQFLNSFKPITDFFKGIIDNIMKGDWSGVFNKLKTAASNAWNWIVQNVPIIGDINHIVQMIKEGNWKGAFDFIGKRALEFWNWLKTNIPFLGDIETFINKIRNGDWAGAFKMIEDAARSTLDFLFGKNKVDNFITQITQIPEKLKAAMNEPGATVFSVIDALLPADFKAAIGWGKQVFQNIVNGVNEAAKGAIRALDPMAASWLKQWDDFWNVGVPQWIHDTFTYKNMAAGIDAVKKDIQDAAAHFWNIFTGKEGGVAKPGQAPGGGFNLADFFGKGGLVELTPETTKQLQNMFMKSAFGGFNLANDPILKEVGTKLWQGFLGVVNSIGKQLTLIGKGIYNFVTKGLKDMFTVKNIMSVGEQIANSIRGAINAVSKKFIEIGKIVFGFIWEGLINKVASLPGDIGAAFNDAIGARNIRRAAGFHGIVSGATVMTVGERSAEQVDVTPLSDMVNRKQQTGLLGGTITVVVPVMLDGRQIAEVVANKINRNASTYR